MTEFKLYVVRNSEGKYFRAKGYGGSGESWVEDLQKARIYSRIGTARACVTFYATEPKYKDFLPPVLVELTISESKVLDEKERLAKVVKKKKTEKEQRELRDKKWQLERAEIAYEQAKENLEKAKQWLHLVNRQN